MKHIDLSDDVFRQTIVDKENDEYLGHVSAIILEDKRTILVAYPKGHGRGEIVLKRSNDGGFSWSERLNTPASWDTSLQAPTLFAVKDALIMVTGLYPIRMSVSRDEGQTWSELVPIGDFGGNVSFSDMLQLNNSDYMAFFHDDGRYIRGGNELKYQAKKNGVVIYECYAAKKSVEYQSKIYKTISKDGGITWENPVEIVSHTEAFLAEAASIRSPDSNQIALIMRENTRKFNSFVSLSNDEGRTWSALSIVAKELTGDRHCLKYLSDGRIVAVFRDMHADSPYYGDWVAWIGKYDDIINNKQGQYKILLKRNYCERFGDCGYSGLLVLPDDTVVAITYGSWTKGEKPYILSVRLNIDDF